MKVWLKRAIIASFVGAVLSSGSASMSAAQLHSGDYISYPDRLYSDNGTYYLEWFTGALNGNSTHYIQRLSGAWNTLTDGGWCCGYGTHSYQWGTDTGTTRLIMQSDGNVVMYNSSFSTSLWATGTNGNSGAFLNMQNDSNLVVYTASSVPIWSIA